MKSDASILIDRITNQDSVSWTVVLGDEGVALIEFITHGDTTFPGEARTLRFEEKPGNTGFPMNCRYRSFSGIHEHFLNYLGVFEELVFGIAPLGAAAAVFRLLDDVQESVFFEQVTDTTEREVL